MKEKKKKTRRRRRRRRNPVALFRDTQARDATEEREAHTRGRDRMVQAAKMAVSTSPASLARSSGQNACRDENQLCTAKQSARTQPYDLARIFTLTTNISKAISDLPLPPSSLRLIVRRRLLTPFRRSQRSATLREFQNCRHCRPCHRR